MAAGGRLAREARGIRPMISLSRFGDGSLRGLFLHIMEDGGKWGLGGAGEIERYLRAVLAGKEQSEGANAVEFGQMVALLPDLAGDLPRNGDIGRIQVDVVGDQWVTRADDRNACCGMREFGAAIGRALSG